MPTYDPNHAQTLHLAHHINEWPHQRVIGHSCPCPRPLRCASSFVPDAIFYGQRITGFGERLAFKTPTYAADLLNTPIAAAASRAFAMAGLSPADIDMVSIYDCYTITVLMTLEDAGFCPKGKAAS